MGGSESAEAVSSFIEHHGVKGMRWGVRKRDSGGSTSSTSITKRSTKKNGKVEVGKASKHNVSEDAMKTKLNKATAKKHSTNALSTAELQSLVNRMNLEQQYSKLTYKPSMRDRAKKLIGKTMNDVAEKQAARLANHIIGQQLDKAFKIPKKETKTKAKVEVPAMKTLMKNIPQDTPILKQKFGFSTR